MDKKGRVAYYPRDEKAKNWIEVQSNQSEAIENLINEKLGGKPITDPEHELDLETKKQKLRKLTAEASIKEKELAHWDTFGTSPSPQARNAITQSVTERGLTKQEIYNVKSKIALRWDIDRFKATCPFCRNPFTYPTENEAVADMARHFEAMHSKVALK